MYSLWDGVGEGEDMVGAGQEDGLTGGEDGRVHGGLATGEDERTATADRAITD